MKQGELGQGLLAFRLLPLQVVPERVPLRQVVSVVEPLAQLESVADMASEVVEIPEGKPFVAVAETGERRALACPFPVASASALGETVRMAGDMTDKMADNLALAFEASVAA